MSKNNLLGKLSQDAFIKKYWNKKPLLVRQAIENFEPLISCENLLQMAASAEVESRLITCFSDHWSLKTGPFSKLPPVKKTNWTILFQGMNLHNENIDQLMRKFDFISNTSLDDLMISYATDGGGVGAHFDSYSVFLLQAYGRRRWRIGKQSNLDLVEGMPLKLLKNFEPEQEFILEPGDMLYLPPNYAHEGVAIGECMTYSIGFRGVSEQEIAEEFLRFMADSVEFPNEIFQITKQATKTPANISKSLKENAKEVLKKIKFTDYDIKLFLGEYFSQPAATINFEYNESFVSSAIFKKLIKKYGIKLNNKTISLYSGNLFFINGQRYNLENTEKTFFHRLANNRFLKPNDLAKTSDKIFEIFDEWHQNGWIKINQPIEYQ